MSDEQQDTGDSHEWPDTMYCLRVEADSPMADEYLTTRMDDWSDKDTDPIEVLDSREYVRVDKLETLAEEWLSRIVVDTTKEVQAENRTLDLCAQELEELIEDE